MQTKPPKTFRTTDEEDRMIEVRLRELGYANFSPYIRHLIRMDYQKSRKVDIQPATTMTDEEIARLADLVRGAI